MHFPYKLLYVCINMNVNAVTNIRIISNQVDSMMVFQANVGWSQNECINPFELSATRSGFIDIIDRRSNILIYAIVLCFSSLWSDFDLLDFFAFPKSFAQRKKQKHHNLMRKKEFETDFFWEYVIHWNAANVDFYNFIKFLYEI